VKQFAMDSVGYMETRVKHHPQMRLPVNAADIARDMGVDGDVPGGKER